MILTSAMLTTLLRWSLHISWGWDWEQLEAQHVNQGQVVWLHQRDGIPFLMQHSSPRPCLCRPSNIQSAPHHPSEAAPPAPATPCLITNRHLRGQAGQDCPFMPHQ